MKDPMLKFSRKLARYAEQQAAKMGMHVECMAVDIKFECGSTLRTHAHPTDDVTQATYTTTDEVRTQ